MPTRLLCCVRPLIAHRICQPVVGFDHCDIAFVIHPPLTWLYKADIDAWQPDFIGLLPGMSGID
jgi:hypothetical protein